MTLHGLAREHFQHPRNAGCLEMPGDMVGRGCAGHVQSGIEVEFQVAVSGDGRLTALCWECFGPPEAIAAASWLSEELPGSTPAQAAAWTAPAICEALSLSAQAVSGVLVVEDALRGAFADLERQT